mgnify:CR=1 FL=1
MNNIIRVAGLATAMTLGAVGAGHAESHKGGGHQGGHHRGMQLQHSFGALDTDGDGSITPEEMAGHMRARFEGADSDGDGVLSREELVARMMERRAERIHRHADHMIDRHDANGDGRLSMDEMRADHRPRMFERVDTDGNGAISAEEFDAMRARRGDGPRGGMPTE